MAKKTLSENVDAFIEKHGNIYGGKSYQELKDEEQQEEFMRKLNLTPKQKAAQLVALFESIAHPTIDCDKQFAKECARRCIDEIIDTNPFFEKKNEKNDCVWYQPESNIIYWELVKKEIDTL